MTTPQARVHEAWSTVLRNGTGPVQDGFLGLVQRTKDSRHYCAELVWGNLQTADYARAVLQRVVNFHGVPDDIEAGVAARTARAALIGRDGRSYHTLLGEQALRARFGGVEVMRGQLAHLLAATERAGLLLGIIPSRAELAGLPGHSFGIFDGKLVHVETTASGLDITDEADLAVYEKAFALLQRSAVYGDAARDLIREELAALR
ncbi:DUF5753 domain-containing protein [Streptomyces uncialis]|uniref:DUF5753 domain-containing protein n=1 Tax=Streptomyces uncialis TaxID=1048205 RepID=UPI00224CC692|nr:DUF5753 domain-containing protein [Streptomyces uncialis]MCX4664247.1 DUF5753 domain-containing protein [Streptomyces uncialis]